MENNSWIYFATFVPLLIRIAVVVMIVIMTVTLVKILRALKPRQGFGIQVIPDGGDSAGAAGFAGIDPQVVAAIAAAVTVMGQAEGKRLVVRSVRRDSGWADAGRRESVY